LDIDKNERVKIGIGTCRNLSIILIYGPCGMENYIVVLIKAVNEAYEQRKLFCPIPSVRYCGSMVGMEIFWPCKYLSMNDEMVKTAIEQCHVIMDGVLHFSKK
jgi:hypothetical protein